MGDLTLRSTARQHRVGYAAHYWTIRKDFNGDNPTDIALPRNAHTCLYNSIPTEEFDRVLLIARTLPETIVAAMVGRRIGELFDHPMFGVGTKSEHAVITWAQHVDGMGFVAVILDRPVHPRPTRKGFDYSANPAPEPQPAWQQFINNELVEPWRDPDDTPLDQDDQSWRDLTDDDIAAIRAIPDPSDHAAR